MTGRRIEEEIAENRSEARKLDARFIESVPQGTRALTFSPVSITVTATVSVEERQLGSGLVSGHPAPEHGSGRGVSGDTRGGWTEVDSTEATRTTAALDVHAEGLADETVGYRLVEAGSDGAATTTTATSLGDGAGFAYAWPISRTDTTDVRGVLGASRVPAETREVGAYADDERLMVRAVFDNPLPVDADSDLRVTFTFDYAVEDSARIAVTALDSIIDAAASPYSTVSFDSMELGTGTTDPDSTDSGVESHVITKAVDPRRKSSRATATTTVFRSQPDTQPVDISEIALVLEDGTPATRRTFESVTKDGRIQLRIEDGVRFK